MKRFLVLWVIFWFLSYFSLSNEGEEKRKEVIHHKIVVTATKTPHTLKDSPVETVLITKEEIKKSSANNISELLRNIPGFYILGENVPGSSAWQSRLRGLDFDRAYGLILINGERVLGGGMGEYGISLNQIPLEMIERVEIVKGPISALYGSDAIAGVINIILKSIPSEPLFTSSIGYGSEETSSLNIGYGRWINKFGFFLSASREASKRGRYGGGEDNFKGHYGYTRFAYRLSPSATLNLGLNYDDQRRIYAIEKKWRISPSFEVTSRDSILKIRCYWHKLNLDSFSPGYTRRFGNITYTQAEAQYTRYLGKKQIFTIGGEYLIKDIDANFADKIEKVASLYFQDEIDMKNFKFALGGRIDNHSLYGTEFNPKTSVIWNLKDSISLRASVGRAFKSPTIRQLYVFFKHGPWWNKPNEKLAPEISWGYSFSIDGTFSEKFFTSLSLFRNDLKDLIVPVESDERINNSPVRTWQNIQKAYAQGFEVSLDSKVLDNLSLGVGYTFLDSKNRYTNKKLPYNPRDNVSININYQIKPLKASIHWTTNYVSRAYRDEANTKMAESYSVSNLKLIKELKKNFMFSFEAHNIFDSDFGEPDKEWLGRTIFARLIFNF